MTKTIKFFDLEAYFNAQISGQLRTRAEKAGIPEKPGGPKRSCGPSGWVFRAVPPSAAANRK